MTNEEIIRGAYVAGKKRITCPVCEGGESREEDTMSVWLNERGIHGRCYRATCGAHVRIDAVLVADDIDRAAIVRQLTFEPRPLRAPYRRVTTKDYWGREWLARTYAPDFFADAKAANERGMRVLVENPDTCVWRLRALDGTQTGHITRTKDKKISTYKDLDRPLYYWNTEDVSGLSVFLFEDAMSAALCPKGAIALLGTSISPGVVDELKSWCPNTVLVCLDPGAEEAAAKVYQKLVAAGVPATFVPMAKDYKDMTLEERKILEETYA